MNLAERSLYTVIYNDRVIYSVYCTFSFVRLLPCLVLLLTLYLIPQTKDVLRFRRFINKTVDISTTT